MIWRRGFFWTLLLLGANLLLLMGIVHVWWGGEDAPALSRARKGGPEVPKAPILRDQQPLDAFRVVATKNLFSQNRAGPDPGQPGARGNLEGRSLMGTIIIGQEKAALIGQTAAPGQRHKTQQVDVLRLGEQWDGFKVVEISNEAVILQGKEGKKTLTFPE